MRFRHFHASVFGLFRASTMERSVAFLSAMVSTRAEFPRIPHAIERLGHHPPNQAVERTAYTRHAGCLRTRRAALRQSLTLGSLGVCAARRAKDA